MEHIDLGKQYLAFCENICCSLTGIIMVIWQFIRVYTVYQSIHLKIPIFQMVEGYYLMDGCIAIWKKAQHYFPIQMKENHQQMSF